MADLNKLPSVERVLQLQEAAGLSKSFGRPLTVAAIRASLERRRQEMWTGRVEIAPDVDAVVADARTLLTEWMDAHLRGVINATGVILHTNLGRAPLSRSSIEAMVAVTQAYANVEFNLQSGKRGDRMEEIEALLTRLTAAERALVVNNNASAVLLALSALAARKRVIIGRSQLVEIGGGFRMPDVMRLSGVKLVEVGTTNKVHLGD